MMRTALHSIPKSSKQESISSVLAETVETMPGNTLVNEHTILAHSAVESLKQSAQEQLRALQQQEDTIISVQSNLDLLLKRYNVEKGYFSRAAEWYGEQAWWLKIIFGLIVVGIGAGLGAIFHMPIAIGCISAALYLVVAYLFINHYNVSEKRHKRLCEDILEMEKSLKETISHFSALTISLKKTMLALCELNTHMTEDLKVLDDQLQDLQKKLDIFANIVQEINNAKEVLVASTLNINAELEEADSFYNGIHQTMSQQSTVLMQTNQELGEINAALLQDQQKLSLASNAFQKSTEQIAVFCQNFQTSILELKKRGREEQELREKLIISMDSSLNATTQNEDIISHAQSTMTQAEAQLAEHEKQRVFIQNNRVRLDAQIQQMGEENDATIERVNSLLQRLKWQRNPSVSF